jgi:glucose dehydrogenase
MKKTLHKVWIGIFLLLSSVFFAVNATGNACAQVTFKRLLHSSEEPQNWLTYSGDYAGRRFSALDEVKTANVRSLVVKWVFQTGATGKLETTPLVVDGVLYATGQDDRALLSMLAPDDLYGYTSVNCRLTFDPVAVA